MTIHYRTQGFVLKKTDLGEADRIFIIFTKDFGKLEILGKGIRKIQSKLKSFLELFHLIDLEFIQGKIYKTLIDASVIDSFKEIRKDLKRFKIANLISQIFTDFLKGEEKDENLWKLLKETFEKLNNYFLSSKNLILLYYYFFWNFFSFLGYQISLYNCSLCQRKLRPENLYFSQKEGGIICALCFRKERGAKKINLNVIKILRLILKRDFQTLKKIKIEKVWQRQLKMISESYLSFLKEMVY